MRTGDCVIPGELFFFFFISLTIINPQMWCGDSTHFTARDFQFFFHLNNWFFRSLSFVFYKENKRRNSCFFFRFSHTHTYRNALSTRDRIWRRTDVDETSPASLSLHPAAALLTVGVLAKTNVTRDGILTWPRSRQPLTVAGIVHHVWLTQHNSEHGLAGKIFFATMWICFKVVGVFFFLK